MNVTFTMDPFNSLEHETRCGMFSFQLKVFLFLSIDNLVSVHVMNKFDEFGAEHTIRCVHMKRKIPQLRRLSSDFVT